jgi:hypothetical protein
MQRLLGAAALCALFACIPDTTTGTSSGGGGGGTDGGDGSSGEGGPSLPSDRVALCAAYGNATAQCCAQVSCPTTSADDWRKRCETYAASCPAMPTCFSGSDCNTLIYCSGGC